MRTICPLPLFIAALLLAGCSKDAKTIDEKEERDPLVKTGQSYMDIEDWNKAEDAFKQAIENEPRMARPHLQLATIYQQHKPDYAHAIYHYDRYLELRPDSEKAGLINDQKQKIEQALAYNIIKNSPDVQRVVSQLQAAQRENAELKRQLAGMQPKSAATVTPAQQTVTKTVPKSATQAVNSNSAAHQIYHVEGGDNLTKIAQKFYGNDEWEPIYEANRDRMKSPGDLRVGQTLVIPKK
ncbi:LysM peptidoglycan-binding domain-containing protein [Pontiella sulfatireligans]|uniref:LysM domain-containing protein n=1 Tax=Pontiella sulfatireligans TaxID=2750658 RepID=A0A6C2USK5_9BACT|nr:LysM peptidoglycan-binding domain-containing protein [Pontiella sulfatireligans]VGO23320.1 hypothetical protein SCARR_05427 [Pontiella sulfatireligans]